MIRLFEHKDFGGKTYIISGGAVTGLPDFNDKASSCEVISDTEEYWLLYQHNDYRGDVIGPFKYGNKYPWLGEWKFNDKVSSAKVFTDTDSLSAETDYLGSRIKSQELIENYGDVTIPDSVPILGGLGVNKTLLGVMVGLIALVVIVLVILKTRGGD